MPWQTLLEFEPHGPESEESITQIENLVGVRLPEDYRSFLLTTGGGYVCDGLAECTVHAPFGGLNITEFSDAAEVLSLLDSNITPRNMICIGAGHFSRYTCISIAGLDHGQVYALDGEMRYFWTQETLAKMPHLLPSIKEFFRLLESGELPDGPWGYENCYHVADSFDEFLSKLHR